MDFKSSLRELAANVDGCIGAGLVGLDGLVVDQVAVRADFDITIAGADYASVLRNALKASRQFGLGRAGELMISTEKAYLLMATVGEGYFAALALEHDGNLGRGRLELKRQAAQLERALA